MHFLAYSIDNLETDISTPASTEKCSYIGSFMIFRNHMVFFYNDYIILFFFLVFYKQKEEE